MLFKKSKTKLELEAEVVASLVKDTNKEINELGRHGSALYDALTNLQNLFDKIRNVPSDKLILYQKIKEVSLSWNQQVEKIGNDYDKAKIANIGGGAAGTAFGVGVSALGPTAAMGIATTFGVASTGTAISSLSGAAATNAALAWLGGGALSAGGGGMAAGNALLGLAGPVGWTIAGIALVGSAILFWKAKSDRNTLERIFLLISKRDQNSYKQAIVELKERIKRIIDETGKLNAAIRTISTIGFDYTKMTEEQQYTLGAYVNLMNASTQLLVNPILSLRPKVTQENLNVFLYKNISSSGNLFCKYHKDLIVYMANVLYKIDTNESERKLLSKSFRGNKEFRKCMKLEKQDLDIELFNTTDALLKYVYINQ